VKTRQQTYIAGEFSGSPFLATDSKLYWKNSESPHSLPELPAEKIAKSESNDTSKEKLRASFEFPTVLTDSSNPEIKFKIKIVFKISSYPYC
jgi:hypothetical protein